MLDPFNRPITYLRISLTDRCNFRCIYCMPEKNVSFLPESQILTLKEWVEVVKFAASIGIYKIRFTGGEPLMYKNIVEIVEKISGIKGIKEICLTTNGSLLSKYAWKLKKAGLTRVNVSLDTIDTLKFNEITRNGNLTIVMEGIYAAIEAGLVPIKINFVKIDGVNNDDEEKVRNFCKKNNLEMRVIRQMNLQIGEFYPVNGGYGGICSLCNRLRITAEGTLLPCLFSNIGFNVRTYGVENAFLRAIGEKPEKGIMNKKGYFYNIGG